MKELIPELLPEDQELPFWSHIGELRDRLLRSLIAIFIGTACAYALRFHLWAFAKRPLITTMSAYQDIGGQAFAYTDLAEPFMALMRLSFWTAVITVSPYIFFQLWMFVKPALREREKSIAVTFVGATSACFLMGAAFAYFVLFGALSRLLMEEALKAGLRPSLKPTEYLNLFLYTVVGAGVIFETPILFYFLGRFGLVRSSSMIAYWREAVLAILFVAGFLTPGDVIATMIIFGTVMLALYGVSILIVRLVEPPVQ